MRYVVAYDIEDDRIRARIAEIVEGFGTRVQRSVFECELEPTRLNELVERLRTTLESPQHGQIRVYRLCANCFAKSFGMGAIQAAAAEPAIIVA